MTLRIDGVPALTSHDSFHGYRSAGQVMHLSCDLPLARAGAEAAVNKKGRGLSCWFIEECASEGVNGCGYRQTKTSVKNNTSYKLMILECFILKEGNRSPECALMREEFLIWSSVRWCVAVICRATATVKECLWCWLVWVLLSILLSQRFVIQRLCEWCPRAHLASSWL